MILSIPNNLLQGKLSELGNSFGSFIVNSSVGILGFFNPAEKLGLKPHKEDVGQTLGTYGFGPGCYFVMPILGPTTLRDSLGMVADTFIDPFAHVTIREKELFGLLVPEGRYQELQLKNPHPNNMPQQNQPSVVQLPQAIFQHKLLPNQVIQ